MMISGVGFEVVAIPVDRLPHRLASCTAARPRPRDYVPVQTRGICLREVAYLSLLQMTMSTVKTRRWSTGMRRHWKTPTAAGTTMILRTVESLMSGFDVVRLALMLTMRVNFRHRGGGA